MLFVFFSFFFVGFFRCCCRCRCHSTTTHEWDCLWFDLQKKSFLIFDTKYPVFLVKMIKIEKKWEKICKKTRKNRGREEGGREEEGGKPPFGRYLSPNSILKQKLKLHSLNKEGWINYFLLFEGFRG